MKMKNFFGLIFIFIFICFISSVVSAVDINNEEYYQKLITNEGLTSDEQNYVFAYDFPTYNNFLSGAFFLPVDMFNSENPWLIFYNSQASTFIYVENVSNKSYKNLYLRNHNGDRYSLSWVNGSNRNIGCDTKIYTYDSTSHSWSLTSTISSSTYYEILGWDRFINMFYYPLYYITSSEGSSIMYYYINNSSKTYSIYNLVDSTIKRNFHDVSTSANNKYTVNMGSFHSFVSEPEFLGFPKLNSSLTKISMNIYKSSDGSFVSSSDNILSSVSIRNDDNNNYFMDFDRRTFIFYYFC